MVKPNIKTEYPTHSTVGGYIIAYITTDGDCYCGNCIADVVDSDIYLLPEEQIRNYDYPLDTILYDERANGISQPCENCDSELGN